MRMITTVLNREEFQDKPPILLDIGASGNINPKWKEISKYSICIAFDADSRDISYTDSKSKFYRKLCVYNSLVTEKSSREVDFFLTSSPYCSSTLKPDVKSLNEWAFSALFEVDSIVKLKSVDLSTVLSELQIEYVDWFKTDSQGIDLRLFKSLGGSIVQRVLAAEFEPGILDSYVGEDKLHELMSYMDTLDFWMSDLNLQGSQRANMEVISSHLGDLDRKSLKSLIRISPGWGEVSYLNSFKNQSLFDQRDFLLGWVFSLIERQYGFALELAINGCERFNDPIFQELINYTLFKIRKSYLKIPVLFLSKALKKAFKKIFSLF